MTCTIFTLAAYPFTVFLSVDDSYTLIGALEYEQNHCQQAVANYIWTRPDVPEAQRPSADRIMAQSDDFFYTFLNFFLSKMKR